MANSEDKVWIEGGITPVVGQEFTIVVNVGAFRPEPKEGETRWGERENLDLSLFFTSCRAEVRPEVQPVVLPRVGDVEHVKFKVTPKTEGEITFYLGFHLIREALELGDYTILIEVQPDLETHAGTVIMDKLRREIAGHVR